MAHREALLVSIAFEGKTTLDCKVMKGVLSFDDAASLAVFPNDLLLPGMLVSRIRPIQGPPRDSIVWDLETTLPDPEIRSKLMAAVDKARAVIIRTPLTWDNLYAWAEKFVGKEHASAESVLVDLLAAHDYQNLGDYGIQELRETILDLHKNGTVGYVQMERDDLKKECEERFLDPDTCGMDLSDLEDLIEAMGFDMEPTPEVEPKTGEVKIVLSDSQRASVLEDFMAWSGGFHPRECDIDQIEKYVEHGADAELDENAVEEFLEECRTSPEPRG